MARRLSRRALATYMADALVEGKHRSTVIKQLAAYLLLTRRTDELDLIVRDVSYLLSQQGIISATVTSAFELETETKTAIKQLIAAETKATQVSIDTVIEPSVLGGVKINVPGAELDQTITHQLTVLKTRFKKA